MAAKKFKKFKLKGAAKRQAEMQAMWERLIAEGGKLMLASKTGLTATGAELAAMRLGVFRSEAPWPEAMGPAIQFQPGGFQPGAFPPED